MMKELKTGLVYGIISGLISLMGTLAVPMLLLVACNVIDYATGLMAAKYRSQSIDSYKGFKGIAKKVCMWLLVVVGAVVDELLITASDTMGIETPFAYLVAIVVAVWLTCNEILSILENIGDIGVPVPGFLRRLTKNIKSQVEAKTEGENEDEQVEG